MTKRRGRAPEKGPCSYFCWHQTSACSQVTPCTFPSRTSKTSTPTFRAAPRLLSSLNSTTTTSTTLSISHRRPVVRCPHQPPDLDPAFLLSQPTSEATSPTCTPHHEATRTDDRPLVNCRHVPWPMRSITPPRPCSLGPLYCLHDRQHRRIDSMFPPTNQKSTQQ